jgi:hypothetical protein
MNNLDIYNKVRQVPQEAQKAIAAGRLKGKTDINPMWRIKMLTETFGMVGFGWYTEIVEQWLEQGVNNEVSAYVKINLYVKHEGEWSRPIAGIGGSMYISNEAKGPYVDDECYKKAYTDAISVACKALGMGADVYWNSDSTKYTKQEAQATQQTQQTAQKKSITHSMLTPDFLKTITTWLDSIRNKYNAAKKVFSAEQTLDYYYTFEDGAKEVITKYYSDHLTELM